MNSAAHEQLPGESWQNSMIEEIEPCDDGKLGRVLPSGGSLTATTKPTTNRSELKRIDD